MTELTKDTVASPCNSNANDNLNVAANPLKDVIFVGKQRCYLEDLTKRDYSLENTTPQQLTIEGKVLTDHAWSNLLCKTAKLLLDLYPHAFLKFIDNDDFLYAKSFLTSKSTLGI